MMLALFNVAQPLSTDCQSCKASGGASTPRHACASVGLQHLARALGHALRGRFVRSSSGQSCAWSLVPHMPFPFEHLHTGTVAFTCSHAVPPTMYTQPAPAPACPAPAPVPAPAHRWNPLAEELYTGSNDCHIVVWTPREEDVQREEAGGSGGGDDSDADNWSD